MTVVTPIAGVNKTKTYSSAEYVELGISLGTRVGAEDNKEYCFVKAGNSIAKSMYVTIDEDFTAVKGTKAGLDDGHQVGVCDNVAISSGEYGWVITKGTNIKVLVAPSCAADVALYSTATAGILDDTSASQTKVDGIVAVAATAATATDSVECIMTWAKSTTF